MRKYLIPTRGEKNSWVENPGPQVPFPLEFSTIPWKGMECNAKENVARHFATSVETLPDHGYLAGNVFVESSTTGEKHPYFWLMHFQIDSTDSTWF
jgi:hypothetical protein